MYSVRFGWAARAAAAAAVTVLLASAAQAQGLREIRIRNDCRSPVELLIRHADAYHNWHPHGWYKLTTGQSSSFEADGVTLRQLDDHELYFYAQSTDGTGRYWQDSSGSYETFKGAQYRFQKMNTSVDDNGRLFARITCD